MVVPQFDLIRMLYPNAIACPTCNDERVVFMATSTISFNNEEQWAREKLYGWAEQLEDKGAR